MDVATNSGRTLLQQNDPNSQLVSPLPRERDGGTGAGSRGTFVLAQPHSHNKTSLGLLVPAISPSSLARDLARYHNRTLWAH